MLIGVAATMSVGLGLIYLIGTQSVMGGFNKLERQTAVDSITRAQAALKQQLDGIDTTISNWSSWDDAYTFVQDGNDAFISSNLGDSVFGQIKANLLVFVNGKSEIVWGKAYDLAAGTATTTFPAGFQNYVATGSRLLDHPDLAAPVEGIISVGNGPMLVVSRAILRSNGSGPSHGTLIIGRYIDAAEVATLTGLTHLALSVTALSGGEVPASAPADVRAAAAGLSAASPVTVDAVSDTAIAGYMLLTDIDGKPVVILQADMPRDVYAQGQQSLGIFLLLLPLLGLALVVMLFFLVDRLIVSPLAGLSSAADRVAEGDVTAEVDGQSRDDEIGEVARAFGRTIAYLSEAAAAADMVSDGDLTTEIPAKSENDALSAALDRMVDNLRILVGQVADASSQVNGVARGLALHATELSQTTAGVAASVADVSTGTIEQGHRIEEILSSIIELGDRVSDVRTGGQQIDARIEAAESAMRDLTRAIRGATAAAGDVQSVAASAAEIAKSGASSVRETVSGMARISDVVHTASVKVADLGAKGNQIGAIVETIDDIAAQTNLLALNAAIEAARAGEQGKGFAVVADEVRKLAERSSRATKEIASLISQVQLGTQEAVAAMDAGAAEVSQGTELATRSGQAIEELASAVAATRQAAEQIGSRINIMSEASTGVVGAIREIDQIAKANGEAAEAMLVHASTVFGQLDEVKDVTRATAGSAAEVRAAADSMNDQAQSLAGAADSLVMTARTLARQTKQFRLPESADPTADPTAEAAEAARRAA
jgi:methyl-accepting chemotaxis protein